VGKRVEPGSKRGVSLHSSFGHCSMDLDFDLSVIDCVRRCDLRDFTAAGLQSAGITPMATLIRRLPPMKILIGQPFGLEQNGIAGDDLSCQRSASSRRFPANADLASFVDGASQPRASTAIFFGPPHRRQIHTECSPTYFRPAAVGRFLLESTATNRVNSKWAPFETRNILVGDHLQGAQAA